jgi:hypothetical protein
MITYHTEIIVGNTPTKNLQLLIEYTKQILETLDALGQKLHAE